MDLKWSPGRVSGPASAAVRVTDLSWQGHLNPSPLMRDDGELLKDEYLSPKKLKALTGVDDLQQVKVLEMRVNTRESSLGNLGVYLPNLRELKLNNSFLVSVRDLGTRLSHLRVLWMTCCGLSDLDGISSCSSVKELYIAYNNISDLSQLLWLDHLEVLDLEGNNIEDIDQMQYLGLCCKLSRLTLEGNLICLKPNAESAEEPDYNYRVEIKKHIPHLEYLDEIPASQTALLPSKKMQEDWLIIKESIKGGGLAGYISWLAVLSSLESQQLSRKEDKALSAFTSFLTDFSVPCSSECAAAVTVLAEYSDGWAADARRSSSTNLLDSGCPLPYPTASGELFPEDYSSALTHGLSQVICGNPTKALRARRQKLGPPAVSPVELCSLRTENQYGSGRGGHLGQEDVFSELRAWRQQPKQCLQTHQQEKSAQALKVTLNDEEEGEGCSLTDSCEDELGETCDEDLTERIYLHSSYHSCLSQSSSASSLEEECASVFYLVSLIYGNARLLDVGLRSSNSIASKKPFTCICKGWCSKTLENEEPRRNHRPRAGQAVDTAIPVKGSSGNFSSASGQGTCSEPAQHANCLRIPRAAPACWEQQPAKACFRMSSWPGCFWFSFQSGRQWGQCRYSDPECNFTTVFLFFLWPIMDESPPGEMNHHHPRVCSSTKASERSGLMDAAWPLTARAMLQSLPDRPTASTASQNKHPQS
ncbi:leucine-rich repeat-containing protein 56 [Podargus strigoides]